jgi:Ni,Fe-hydrogenase I large subunit
VPHINNVEGKINIDLYPKRAGEDSVDISSNRPIEACSILVGKTPEQALSIIPLVFSLCGVAQSRAGLSAIQSHLGIETMPDLERARDFLVVVETAREHLLRIAMDWPALFGFKAATSRLSYVAKLLTAFKSSLFEEDDAFSLRSHLTSGDVMALVDQLDNYLREEVFSVSADHWLNQTGIDELIAWIQDSDSTAARSIKTICDQGWATLGMASCEPLPELNAGDLFARLDEEAPHRFIAEPEWQGRCCETTSLTRQLDHPLVQALLNELGGVCLLTRYVARLIELAKVPQQLRGLLTDISLPIETEVGRGLAQVEAARGRLVHRVDIDDRGMIQRYQILAPTEWNFHPRGIVRKGLENLQGRNDEELDQLAKIFINTVDPCVGYSLSIH